MDDIYLRHKNIKRIIYGHRVLRKFVGGGVGIALHLKKKDGNEAIIKIAISDGINNGRRKLIREAKQINHLRKKYLEMRNILPEVVNVWEGIDYAVVEYPFYKGDTYASLVRSGVTPNNKLYKTLKKITAQTIKAYTLNYKKKKNDFLETKNLSRAVFRVSYVHSKNKKIHKLMSDRNININGKKYLNSKIIIDTLKKDKLFINKISPTFLSDCIHGDLNLTNVMIFRNGSFKFLDFRGSRQKWDVVYDLAKMAFTSGYELIRANDIKSKIENSSKLTLNFTGEDRNILSRWEFLLFRLEELVEEQKLFKIISKNDPLWRSRMRLSFALHYLSDSACRLVAGSFTSQPLASYLLGTIYLNRFMKDKYAQRKAHDFYSMKDIILWRKE